MKRSARGFTLVELLVVISIIAILSTIGMVIYSGSQVSARDTKRKGDIDALAKALVQYALVNRSFPTAIGNLTCSDSDSWSTLGTALAPYITNFPATYHDLTYCYSPDMGAEGSPAGALCNQSYGTTGAPFTGPDCGAGVAAVYVTVEKCTQDNQSGDAARFGYECTAVQSASSWRYMRATDPFW